MILEDINGKAQTNASNIHMVKIEANSVMFDLLTSRLYSDKPLSVIRELSTNALDAQIASGFTGQFKVHLPTRLEPFLTIRDFGTGMDKDTVIDLYGTMGASSKRNSNAYNGALGVGSKSPFAYTAGSAFTVTSYYNNEKTIYSVFADNGIPSIAELGSMPTDEPNGLEVSVPVQTQDIHKFTDAASKLYKYFQVKPKVNVELNLELGQVLYEGDKWKIYSQSNNPVVVMANVAYPIDRQQTSQMQALGSGGLVIYADTGAVQFAASRESLSYTPSTLAYLKSINDQIIHDLTEQVKEIPKKYEGKLLEMQHALVSLPHVIKNVVWRDRIHEYIEQSVYFEIVNPHFEWLIPKSYNARNDNYDTITFQRLRGRTIILADSLPQADAVAQHLKSTTPVAILAFTAKRALGTNEEALKKMKEFADLLGIPYKLASEEAIRLFGTTAKTSTTAVATNLMYRATGFNYSGKTTNDYPYVQYNSLVVTAKDKATTIGIPMYNGKFCELDFQTPIKGTWQDIWNVLRFISYPTDIRVVAIPKTHKEHLQNTTDLFAFLKTIGQLEVDVVTQQLISELTKDRRYFISYVKNLQVPQALKDCLREIEELYNKPDERYNRQVIESANRIGIPTKVKELGLTASASKAYERYKPLNICTLSNDTQTQQHFVRLANAL